MTKLENATNHRVSANVRQSPGEQPERVCGRRGHADVQGVQQRRQNGEYRVFCISLNV